MTKKELQDRNQAAAGYNAGPAPPPTTAAVIDEPPWLLSIEQLSFLLNRSVPSLERDTAAGRLPAAVRIGGSRRWRRHEILGWVEAGCPPRID